MVFLTGHSGAGKSTLLKILAALEKPSTGEIIVDGISLTHLAKRAVPAYRRTLGIIFQTPYLLSDRSVFDNVALPLQLQNIHSSVMKKRVHAALDKVGILEKEHMLPSYLSTGEQQRVGIARAIVHKPSWVLADEPTGNLDPVISADIMNVFTELNQAGVGVVVATHDLALIARMKHRILVLKRGHLS